jgi:hypothetical protein
MVRKVFLFFLFWAYRNTPYLVPATDGFMEKIFWPVFELLVPVLYQKRTHFDQVKYHF